MNGILVAPCKQPHLVNIQTLHSFNKTRKTCWQNILACFFLYCTFVSVSMRFSGLIWNVGELWWLYWTLLDIFNGKENLFYMLVIRHEECETENFWGFSYWLRNIISRVTYKVPESKCQQATEDHMACRLISLIQCERLTIRSCFFFL